jgi:putative flippase GtrA
VASTIVYVLLYLILRSTLGMYGANALALGLCTVGNTVAHARFTFGSTSRIRMHHAVAAGTCAFITGVGFTSLDLGLGQLLGATSPVAEATAIILGATVASIVRFVLLQAWMFRTHARSAAHARTATVTAAAA